MLHKINSLASPSLLLGRSIRNSTALYSVAEYDQMSSDMSYRERLHSAAASANKTHSDKKTTRIFHSVRIYKVHFIGRYYQNQLVWSLT